MRVLASPKHHDIEYVGRQQLGHHRTRRVDLGGEFAIWQKLSRDIKAWPNDGGFRREDFKALLPVYRQAGAIKAEPNVDRVIDTRFVEQALKELG